MGVIDRLPVGGDKFHATGGSSSFKDKLKSAIKYNSSLRSLSDNQESIIKAVRKYESLIREGKFGVSQRNSALRQISKEAPLSSPAKNTVKKMLAHLGKSQPVARPRIVRALDDNKPLEKAHLAGQTTLVNNSGLSGVASPNLPGPVNRPFVSISQVRERADNHGLASGPKSASHSSMMPLAK